MSSQLLLPALALTYPQIDPIAFQIGPIALRWYGLAYAAGLLLGWVYIRRLLATPGVWRGGPPMMPDDVDNLLLWVMGGVVIGGRLGAVLLYNPDYYFANPEKILAVWEGGMAFHGGLIGTVLAIWLFSRRNGIRMLSVGDLVAAAVPLGIFFGRIANFVNGELWGRVTDVPWAMVFPSPEAGGLPRHPSQLYEAALEGLVLFVVLRWLIYNRLALTRPGLIAGLFLLGYGLARSFGEFFREDDGGHIFAIGWLTPGIAYSLPMIAFGLWLISRSRAGRRASV